MNDMEIGMTDDNKKVNAYMKMLNQDVVEPLLTTQQGESNTSKILLVFASIDGLGKLIHPDESAKVRERFSYYISNYIPMVYHSHIDELYKMRCLYTNNALSFSSFVSWQKDAELHHLQYQSGAKYLHIEGTAFFQDFFESMMTLMGDIGDSQSMMSSVANRLRWLDEDDLSFWGTENTPLSNVQYVRIS